MGFFVVWCPEYGATYEDGKTINANGFEDAARQWARRQDRESSDYTIVGGTDLTAIVSDGKSEQAFRVSGESVPEYRAVAVSHPYWSKE